MAMLLPQRYPGAHCPNADTLVYFSPTSPPQRVCSSNLLQTNSLVFRELLGPTHQFCLLRRKKLLQDGLPMGINLVLDLTPPQNGDDDLPEVMERLWCPEEVRRWNADGVGKFLEKDDGVDADCWPVRYSDLQRATMVSLDEDLSHFQKENWGALNIRSVLTVNYDDDDEAWPEWKRTPRPLPAAYSAERHTAALERVLGALHGVDPGLHSATMWYTFYKVSVELGCEKAVADYLVDWLGQERNRMFVEIFTPAVMEMAEQLQSELLFKECYGLAVARALLSGGGGGGFYPTGTDTNTGITRRLYAPNLHQFSKINIERRTLEYIPNAPSKQPATL